MNHRRNLYAVVLLLTFLASAIVGWQRERPSGPSSLPLPDMIAPSTRVKKAGGRGDSHGLASIRQEGDRMRKAIEMARSLPSSEIRAWLDSGEFTFSEGAARILFEKIAFERWANEEPAEFLDWALDKGIERYPNHLEAIVRNRPELIRGILSESAGKRKEAWMLQGLAKVVPDFAFEEAQKILSERSTMNREFQSALTELMKTHPMELEKIFDAMPESENSDLAKVVLTHKLKGDFDATFDRLIKNPWGFDILFDSRGIVKPEQLIDRMGSFPESWRNLLAERSYSITNLFDDGALVLGMDWEKLGFSDVQSAQIRSETFHRAAYSNPLEVFELISDLGFSDDKKSGFYRNVLSRVRTAEEISHLAEALGNPEDREAFLKMAEGKAVASEPLAPITSQTELLAALDRGEISSLRSATQSWTPAQKEELTASFTGLEPTQKTALSHLAISGTWGVSDVLRGHALVHLVTSDQTQAEASFGNIKGIVSAHAVGLLNKDVGQATAFVSQFPEGELRLQAQKNLAINWRNYDPVAAQNWVDSQPELDRAEIRKFLKSPR